jgi:hypothetical protein
MNDFARNFTRSQCLGLYRKKVFSSLGYIVCTVAVYLYHVVIMFCKLILTPWSRVLLGAIMVAHLAKKLPAFMEHECL